MASRFPLGAEFESIADCYRMALEAQDDVALDAARFALDCYAGPYIQRSSPKFAPTGMLVKDRAGQRRYDRYRIAMTKILRNEIEEG